MFTFVGAEDRRDQCYLVCEQRSVLVLDLLHEDNLFLHHLHISLENFSREGPCR